MSDLKVWLAGIAKPLEYKELDKNLAKELHTRLKDVSFCELPVGGDRFAFLDMTRVVALVYGQPEGEDHVYDYTFCRGDLEQESLTIEIAGVNPNLLQKQIQAYRADQKEKHFWETTMRESLTFVDLSRTVLVSAARKKK